MRPAFNDRVRSVFYIHSSGTPDGAEGVWASAWALKVPFLLLYRTERSKSVYMLQTPDFLSPDLVAGFHADPLRDRPVLLLLLGQKAFNPESLV